MITFDVIGNPVPQGSMKAFVRNGKAMLTSTSGSSLKDWRDAIGWSARESVTEILDGPVEVRAVFRILRPKSVSEKKRPWHTVKPDLDKLSRALLDGLTGVVIQDDSQVVALVAQKRYCSAPEQPGVEVMVKRWGA